MLSLYKKSLYRKLLFAFILVGFFPFVILYIYTMYWGEEKIVNKIINDQYIQAQKIIDVIENHITSLDKEIKFISKLDLMDDIIAEDVDKRIARLLIQKKADIGLETELSVVDLNSKVVSSSENESASKEFKYLQELKTSFANNKNHLFIENKLYLCSKIYASFDKNKELGYLILGYDLKNLNTFLTKQEGIHNSIYNYKTQVSIGEKNYLNIDILKEKGDYILEEHLVIYKKMPSIMREWYLVYSVDKKLALNFLYDFSYFMIVMIPIAFILILITGVLSAKNIIKPIENLTKTAERITDTKDYSAEVVIRSDDEIGRLSYAFNKLLQTTNNALETLEEENELRLKRFIKLIEIFNTIIQTKNENECIKVSIKEMQKLTQNDKLHFIDDAHKISSSIPIFVSDFDKDEKIYYGAIALDISELSDKNEDRFYHSIATMISLQLDRIRLVDRTMMASRAKSAFISNMSHELRSPLNAIIGFTQYMIAYEDLSDEQQDITSNIEKSAQYLLEMINEILDIAKIEAGKMEAYFENVNIQSILDDIVIMLIPLAEQKGIRLTLNMDKMDDAFFCTDPKLFKQIVINLLSNAIKFTKTGAIDIEASKFNDIVTVRIKDTGIGISKEDIPKLFNDFTQLENVMQKKHKGSGLGLSISKKLSKLLGGDIALSSEGLGMGTEVRFSISQNRVQKT
ncbi:HAMP domain-containing protein [bacterium]|nr:HAMP domain-containing protein [bacterium]MBU1990949.1 HAMP domain-containing protein [bacterium]